MKKNFLLIFALILIVCCGVTICQFFQWQPTITQAQTSQEYVVEVGSAKKSLSFDCAVIHLLVVSEDEDIFKSNKKNFEKVQSILDLLQDTGVNQKDISVCDSFSREREKYESDTKARTTTKIVFKTCDLENVESLKINLLQANAIIDDEIYQVSNLEEECENIVDMAIEDAKEKINKEAEFVQVEWKRVSYKNIDNKKLQLSAKAKVVFK